MKNSELKAIINNVYGIKKHHLTVGELLRTNDNWLSGTVINIISKDGDLLTSDKLYNLYDTDFEHMLIDHFRESDVYVMTEKTIYKDTDGSVIEINNIYYFKQKSEYTFIGYRLQDVIEFMVNKRLPYKQQI